MARERLHPDKSSRGRRGMIAIRRPMREPDSAIGRQPAISQTEIDGD